MIDDLVDHLDGEADLRVRAGEADRLLVADPLVRVDVDPAARALADQLDHAAASTDDSRNRLRSEAQRGRATGEMHRRRAKAWPGCKPRSRPRLAWI